MATIEIRASTSQQSTPDLTLDRRQIARLMAILCGMSTQSIDYQIRVQGHLDRALSEWFAPLTVSNEPNGEATLSGPIRDQAELYGLLLRLYNLNFTLLAVQRLPAVPPTISTA